MTKKLFVAILIPKEVQSLLKARLDDIVALWPKSQEIELIYPEDYHFTIFYLGRQEEGGIPKILETIKTATENTDSFHIKISDIDYAMSDPTKKMIWAKSLSKDMNEIRTQLWLELSRNKIAFEETRKINNAHINLARFDSGNPADLPKIFTPIDKEFMTETICLMESLPIKDGPKYRIIKSIDLKPIQE